MKAKANDRDLKSGQFKKGNIAALKHGAFSFKLTGNVPSVRGARALMHELNRIKEELEAITPDMNIKKSLLIEQAIKARGFMRLFEMYVKQAGLLNPRLYTRKVIDFQPGFKTYLSMASLQQKILMALGLDTERVDEVLTPLEIAAEFDKKKEAEEKKGKEATNIIKKYSEQKFRVQG